MTTSMVGAPSAPIDDWNAIDWRKVRKEVERLQMRIAKAVRSTGSGSRPAFEWARAVCGETRTYGS